MSDNFLGDWFEDMIPDKVFKQNNESNFYINETSGADGVFIALMFGNGEFITGRYFECMTQFADPVQEYKKELMELSQNEMEKIRNGEIEISDINANSGSLENE